jgi:hypothetical protein
LFDGNLIPNNTLANTDSLVAVLVVLNYTHGERRPHRFAEEGGGWLERVSVAAL